MTEPDGWLFLGHGPMSGAALAVMAASARPRLVVTGPRGYGDNPVERVAASHGLELRRAGLANHDRAVYEQARAAAVAVTCGWTEQLRDPLLGAPREGWLNLHPSSLPSWRGADPIGWQLLMRASSIGCSVHRMTASFDAGPVVARDSIPVRSGDDRGTVMVRAGRVLGRLARDAAGVLLSGGRLAAVAQPDDAVSWCPPLGVSLLLDATRLSARQAVRVVSAFSPRPGVALAQLPGDVRVANAAIADAGHRRPRPGAVEDERGRAALVCCRDAWIRVEYCAPRQREHVLASR